MFHHLIIFLKQIPFWAWVVIPVIVLASVTFLFSKNIRYTIFIVIVAMLVSWLTAGFHFWKLYLHSHYLGGFDQYGLPTQFSRTGWPLLIDAWALWSIPLLIIALFVSIIYYYKKYIQSSKKHKPDSQQTISKTALELTSNQDIQHQLEIQSLKRKITTLETKENKLSGQDTIETLKKQLNDTTADNERLNKKTQSLAKDLQYHKKLLHQLISK